jgi:hypothetical protein
MSKASVLLPLPETPVTTVKRLRGMSTSMFLRLCSRALWTRMAAWLRGVGAAYDAAASPAPNAAPAAIDAS